MNHDQVDTAAATQTLRRTGSGRRAALAATERTTTLYSQTQRQLGGASAAAESDITLDQSRLTSPWPATNGAAGGSASTGGGGKRRHRKARGNSGEPPSTASSAQSVSHPPSRCPFAASVVEAKLLDQALKAVGDSEAAILSIEEYCKRFMIRPPKKAPRGSSPPSPVSPIEPQLPPAWILKQFGKVLDGTPSPPPKLARSWSSLHGHASLAATPSPPPPTRSPIDSPIARPRSPSPMPLDPSPTKKSAKAQSKPTASTSSPNRPPPPGVDPPSPWQLVQSLARHSDDDESHWLPTKPAPSVSRTSLFDLTACASQPQNISRPEVVDLSDSDEDAEVRDVGMGSTKVSGTHGHHADAAKPTCELVDVIDSDDDSGSDDYSVRKLGRVLINGVFDSPNLDLESGRGSSEPSPGTGAVEDDHDSERVSHGSFAPSFGLAAADLTISKMESTKPSSLAPRRFLLASAHMPLLPPVPPTPPHAQQSPKSSAHPDPVSSHSSPIQLGDSDSDVEFVGETAATSSAASKPQPDAHSQSSSRPHINAPTPSTAVPPPSLQLAPISQPRKPKESAQRSRRPVSRTASRGSSPAASTPARTSHTRVLSPVAGSSSDDNEVVCMDPLPAKPTDVSGAHAIGGPASSGPNRPGSRNPSRTSSPTTTRAYGDGNKFSASNRSLRRSRPTSPLASASARTLQAELVNVSSDVEGLAGAMASARKRKLDERVRDDNGVDRDVIVLDDSDDEQEASKRRKIG